ncbi:MAG TPA: ATP-binding protein, partial [Chthoniobacteraceae bacterium]
VELDDALRPLSDPDQIVAAAARHLGEHLQADRCAYAEVEADEDTFDCTGDHCRGVPSVVGRYRFSQFGSESLRCMRSDEPYIVMDIEQHQPPPEDPGVYQMVQVRAVIAVPLYKNGKFVAAMAVHHKTARQWTNEEVELVGSVANRCWEAMARAKVTRDLAIAKEAAEAASRAKDDFLAALSHELRTPLTPVLMAAEDLCEDPALPKLVNETLCMMRRNIGLEARLIDDLLDLTRITRGKLALRMQECEVHSLLGFALEIIKDEALAKGLAIQLELEAKRTLLECDPTRLQQVLWNLLKNAVKFTPGGGQIIVRSRDADDRIAIEVSDTGVGLAPDALERVFLPFEQAGRTHEHRFGGLGLGLSISKAIVEAHHGRIEALSDGPDKGATFRIELPVTDASLGGRAETNGDGAHSTETSDPPARQLKLLVVEDHESTLAILERLLTRAGHIVSTASSVARALEIAQTERFDGVISDIGLPDGTGIDLMHELQARYSLTGIALSGYGMEEDLERSREAGFVSHLVKPVDYAHLRRALAQFGTRAPE